LSKPQDIWMLCDEDLLLQRHLKLGFKPLRAEPGVSIVSQGSNSAGSGSCQGGVGHDDAQEEK